MTESETERRAATLRLRPRHILCANGFSNTEAIAPMGYGPMMVANFARVVREQLRAPGGEDVRIRVTSTADVICAACPFREGQGCLMQERIDSMDAAHATALGVAPGQVIRWGDCLDRVRRRVEPDDLDTLCKGCPWLPLGMCKDGVARLREREPSRSHS